MIRALTLGACVALSAQPATAAALPQAGRSAVDPTSQDAPAEFAGQPDSTESFRLLESRRRDTTHPGDPLRVSGAFENGNDLREGHGALTRSTYKPQFVDEAEARDRQLAMLEGGARHTRAVSTRRSAVRGSLGASDGVIPMLDEDESQPAVVEEGSSLEAWLLSLVVAAASVFALVTQSRRLG